MQPDKTHPVLTAEQLRNLLIAHSKCGTARPELEKIYPKPDPSPTKPGSGQS